MFFISRVVVRAALGLRYSSLFSSEVVLSEENIKRTMAKFSCLKAARTHTHIPAKKAAVLIPICVVDDKVSLLYTLRAANLKSHRGQVSFPGGMQDVADKCLETTALRECDEELGIKEEDVHVWGRGNTIITRSETSVLPVIGQVKQQVVIENLKTNPKEVEEVFTVALEDLCDPDKMGYTQFRGGYSTPVFLGGSRRIWGLTAVITNFFLRSLLPPKVYTHKIYHVPSVRIANNTTYQENQTQQ